MNNNCSHNSPTPLVVLGRLLQDQDEALKRMKAENDRLRKLVAEYSKNSKDLTASIAFNILKSHGLERPDEQLIPAYEATWAMESALFEQANPYELQAHHLHGQFRVTHRRFVFKDGSVIVSRNADNAYGLEGKERFTFHTPNPHEDIVRFV